MTREEFEQITIFKFRNDEAAFVFAATADRRMMVLLGDEECYWVVAVEDGERLVAAGYEEAPLI